MEGREGRGNNEINAVRKDTKGRKHWKEGGRRRKRREEENEEKDKKKGYRKGRKEGRNITVKQ